MKQLALLVLLAVGLNAQTLPWPSNSVPDLIMYLHTNQPLIAVQLAPVSTNVANLNTYAIAASNNTYNAGLAVNINSNNSANISAAAIAISNNVFNVSTAVNTSSNATVTASNSFNLRINGVAGFATTNTTFTFTNFTLNTVITNLSGRAWLYHVRASLRTVAVVGKSELSVYNDWTGNSASILQGILEAR